MATRDGQKQTDRQTETRMHTNATRLGLDAVAVSSKDSAWGSDHRRCKDHRRQEDDPCTCCCCCCSLTCRRRRSTGCPATCAAGGWRRPRCQMPAGSVTWRWTAPGGRQGQAGRQPVSRSHRIGPLSQVTGACGSERPKWLRGGLENSPLAPEWLPWRLWCAVPAGLSLPPSSPWP